MKSSILKTVLISAIMCSALISQGARRPQRPRPPLRPPLHHDAPFNGSLSLLIGAALAYGIKKAYDRKNEGRLA